MANNKLVLYDLPHKIGNKCWSPNTWKTRVNLAYKSIPYDVDWIDLADIKPRLESFGIPPLEGQAGGAAGAATHTLPAVKLPDGSYIMDSLAIARHLDSVQPEPSMHLDTNLHEQAQGLVYKLAIPLFPEIMLKIRDTCITEHSLPFWIDARETLFGMSIEEFQQQKGGDAAWKAAEPAFAECDKFLTENQRDDGPFILGSQLSFGDCILVAMLESLKRTNLAFYGQFMSKSARLIELHAACGPLLERDD